MSSFIARALVLAPKTSLILAVILCAFLCAFAPKLEIDASTQTLLLENDKDLEIWREVSKRYESQNFLVIAYTPKDDLLSNTSLELIKNLSAELQKVPGVSSVFSILNAPLLQNRPMKISELLSHIPSFEDENIDKIKAKDEFLSSPFYKGTLVSKDFKTTAILIYLEPNDEYNAFLKRLENLSGTQLKIEKEKFKAYRDELRIKEHENLTKIRQIIAKYDGAEFQNSGILDENSRIPSQVSAQSAQNTLFLGGMNMIADDMIAFVRSDLGTYGIATLVLTMLCLFLFYQQIRYVLIAILICVLCVGASSGLFGLLGFEITVISSNYIALQLIISLSVIIHLINAYRECVKSRISWSERQIVFWTIKDRLSPCFFAIITTIIGFVSLVVCDIKPLKSLGIMMSASIALSLVLEFWIFAAVMCLLAKKQPNTAFERFFSLTRKCAAIAVTKSGRSAIYIICACAFCVGVFGMSRLEVENSFIGYFKENTDIYKGMALIDKKLGGTIPLDVIVKFKSEEKTSANDELDDFEAEFNENKNSAQYWFNARRMQVLKKVDNHLKNREFVGSVSSFADLLEVGKNLNENRELDALALALLYNGLGGERRALLITPFINIERDELHFSLRIEDSNENLKRAEFLQSLQNELNELTKNDNVEVQVSGVMKLYANMLGALFESQTNSIAFVIIALLLTFVLIFRSLKLASIAIIVNIVPLVCVLGAMGLIGLPLDIMSITIGSISLGIGVDDVIHYIHRYRIELARRKNALSAVMASHESIGYAMYYTSFAVFMGFGVMVTSNFWPTIYFGLLTDLVMFFMLTSALLLLPTMIITLRKLKF